MTIEQLKSLTPLQLQTMLIAMHVRNELEDFHVEYLDDSQMKVLNQIVRNAIYEALEALEDRKEPRNADLLEFLARLIPDYWEVPGRDDLPDLPHRAA